MVEDFFIPFLRHKTHDPTKATWSLFRPNLLSNLDLCIEVLAVKINTQLVRKIFSTGENKFSTGENKFSTIENKFLASKNKFPLAENKFLIGENKFSTDENKFSTSGSIKFSAWSLRDLFLFAKLH